MWTLRSLPDVGVAQLDYVLGLRCSMPLDTSGVDSKVEKSAETHYEAHHRSSGKIEERAQPEYSGAEALARRFLRREFSATCRERVIGAKLPWPSREVGWPEHQRDDGSGQRHPRRRVKGRIVRAEHVRGPR